MENLEELLNKGDHTKIWQKHCGFLDLSMEEFMQIQERLLLEQIELLSQCKLGEMLFSHNKPKSVEEFRHRVPLTTYDFYAPFFNTQDESILPDKPKYWICTTWKGGTHPFKWAPYTPNMVKENIKAFIASILFATCSGKEKIKLKPRDKFLYGMAPLPYFTGIVPYGLENEIEFEYLPEIDQAEKISFKERNILGFEQGLEKGIDIFFGVSSVLLRIGEKFQEGLFSKDSNNSKKSLLAYSRLLKGLIVSKLQRRKLLPKDIWKLKGIICGGTDTRLYKDKIEHFWGVKPLEAYAGTEISIVATQSWNYKDLTFFPDVNFLEFIPEEESIKSLSDPSFSPKTLLLNEVETGQKYELVTTKFKGGAFVRYRVGDIVQITALGDAEIGTKLPQMMYVDRVQNIIDLSGFTRLTEELFNKAISLASINCAVWLASKEIDPQNNPYVHFFIEQSDNKTVEEVEEILHYHICKLDSDYEDLETMLGKKPIKITLLETGSWEYFKKSNSTVVPTLNPSSKHLEKLVEIGEIRKKDII